MPRHWWKGKTQRQMETYISKDIEKAVIALRRLEKKHGRSTTIAAIKRYLDKPYRGSFDYPVRQ